MNEAGTIPVYGRLYPIWGQVNLQGGGGGGGGGVKLIILDSGVQGHSEKIPVLQRGNWPKFDCDKIEYVTVYFLYKLY